MQARERVIVDLLALQGGLAVAQRHEHEHDRELRHAVGRVGGVAHADAECMGSIDIDMVEPDAARGHVTDPAPLKLAEHLGVEQALVDDDDSLCALKLAERLVCQRFGRARDLAGPIQALDDTLIGVALVVTELEELYLHINHFQMPGLMRMLALYPKPRDPRRAGAAGRWRRGTVRTAYARVARNPVANRRQSP